MYVLCHRNTTACMYLVHTGTYNYMLNGVKRHNQLKQSTHGSLVTFKDQQENQEQPGTLSLELLCANCFTFLSSSPSSVSNKPAAVPAQNNWAWWSGPIILAGWNWLPINVYPHKVSFVGSYRHFLELPLPQILAVQRNKPSTAKHTTYQFSIKQDIWYALLLDLNHECTEQENRPRMSSTNPSNTESMQTSTHTTALFGNSINISLHQNSITVTQTISLIYSINLHLIIILIQNQ